MPTSQRALVVIQPILPNHLDGLRATLNRIENGKNDPDGGPLQRLADIHHLRWSVLEEQGVPRDEFDAPPFTPHLLFSTVYDGKLDDHLAHLARTLGPHLRDVYSHCDSGATAWSEREIAEFLRKRRRRFAPHLFFNGTLYRTRDQIDLERRGWLWVVEQIGSAAMQKDPTRDRLTHLRKARLRASGGPPPEWNSRPAFPSDPRPLLEILLVLGALALFVSIIPGVTLGSSSEGIRRTLGWLVVITLWLAVGTGVVHAFLLRWVDHLEWLEAKEPPLQSPYKPSMLGPHPSTREDRARQNELTHLAIVKPGWERMLVLFVVLFWLNLVARYYYARARHLGGITSIHFGHWTILRRERRLLFLSHYDGTFESYLRDFAVNDTNYGLNSVWSNCIGYPQTRRVFRGGARHAQDQFLQFGRDFQHATQVWYSAYPDAQAVHINRNTAVRQEVVSRRRFLFVPLPDSVRRYWDTIDDLGRASR